MSGDTRVVLHHHEIEALLGDPEIRMALLEAAGPVVLDARAGAPKLTGRGAASIRAESVLDGPQQTVHVSWDRDHFYMSFQDLGTSRLPALHFLEDALEGLSS
jgi:HK97 gp10 family phage protein